ncbi:MAG TPA: porin [Usitatibacter sp.]|nr:porin [Usitatibacter sp.]
MQNKKALAIAVGLVFAVPAVHAQERENSGPEPDSVIQMYGKLYPEVVFPSGHGPTAAGSTVSTLSPKPTGEGGIIRRTEVESSNSRLGFRGHEKLSRDLKAIFQLETEFHVTDNDSAFAARDSFVGLDHRQWGTVKLGRMDTPFKHYGDEISFLGVSSGNFVSTSNVLRKTGFGTSSASSFHLRRSNAVEYQTPNWAGFDAAIQYSTDETDTPTRHPHVWSAAAAYTMGPLKFAIAHERHWDLFGGSRNVASALSNFNDQNVRAKDKATQATVIYKLGVHRFEADYIRKEYNENPTLTGKFQSYKNNAYQVLWDARWNRSWRTMLEYIHSNAGSCTLINRACDTGGLDGTQWNFGFAYYFSRQTYLFVMGSILKNGYSARYNNEAEQAPAVGEDVKQYAVGMNHSF